jgi:lysyl-tRNA synthetase class 2
MDQQEPVIELDENTLIAQRKQKLNELRQKGNAFPNDFRRDALAHDLHQKYEQLDHDQLEAQQIPVKVAGRIMMRRIMGKASFIHLQDMSGHIQLYLRQNDLPDGVYEEFKTWDLGDIVGAEGHLFKTKTNELSVKVTSVKLLTKALRPLPDKFHGLADQEVRFRQRYLDLIVNPDARRIFYVRSKIITGIRQFLTAQGFLEVETPMMHPIPGGATARPFITHHNALDMQFYLRVAPELYLKRLVVGGLEKVFEINRSFRNEGVSTRHNPEFTMLEFYQAYADYHDLMDLTEKLLQQLVKEIFNTDVITYQNQQIHFGKPFKRMTIKESIINFHPKYTMADLDTLDNLHKVARELRVPINEQWGKGKMLLEIFEKNVEHLLQEPTFITEYPTEVSPLARCSDNPTLTDRFEFFVGGREIANGFSELNDAEDQAERFRKQVIDKDAGDHEAMHYDADYIVALEHGMPPTAGEGIGIDRLTMLLTDSPSIRDVLLFPHMRNRD